MVNMPVLKLNEQPAGTTPCPYNHISQVQNTTAERKVPNLYLIKTYLF